MQRALVEMLLLSILSGVVGVHVLLRRLAFVTDALTHTVFPGLAIAFALKASLIGGALVSAVFSAVLLTLMTKVWVFLAEMVELPLMSLIMVSPQGAQTLGRIASTLAHGEGLQAHARSAEYRLKN